MILDQQSLSGLLKAPKKKYLKKIVDYAVAISHNKSSTSPRLLTPITINFQEELELTSELGHRLLNALVEMLQCAGKVQFQPERMAKMFSEQFSEQLRDRLIDIVVGVKQDLKGRFGESMGQGVQLVELDWQLDMEVANEKGKHNIPIVSIELTTCERSKLQTTNLEMKGPQFQAFFQNMNKIKEQLAQLIKND